MNSWILGMICLNSSLFPGNSCAPTSEALSKQFGVYQNIDMVQNHVTMKARDVAGKRVEAAAGYGVAMYRFSKGEEIKFGWRVLPVCDRLEVGGSKHSGSLNLKWNF